MLGAPLVKTDGKEVERGGGSRGDAKIGLPGGMERQGGVGFKGVVSLSVCLDRKD